MWQGNRIRPALYEELLQPVAAQNISAGLQNGGPA